jgi:hypothetical protein
VAYTFTADQYVVKNFVQQILDGERERENVPVLYNLQEVVWAELDNLETGEE